MPNWDRICTNCGELGSYLDFITPAGADGADPSDQTCDREEGCGATVEWERECRDCGADLDENGHCIDHCHDDDDDDSREYSDEPKYYDPHDRPVRDLD
jgi:hypothetical protein